MSLVLNFDVAFFCDCFPLLIIIFPEMKIPKKKIKYEKYSLKNIKEIIDYENKLLEQILKKALKIFEKYKNFFLNIKNNSLLRTY